MFIAFYCDERAVSLLNSTHYNDLSVVHPQLIVMLCFYHVLHGLWFAQHYRFENGHRPVLCRISTNRTVTVGKVYLSVWLSVQVFLSRAGRLIILCRKKPAGPLYLLSGLSLLSEQCQFEHNCAAEKKRIDFAREETWKTFIKFHGNSEPFFLWRHVIEQETHGTSFSAFWGVLRHSQV